VPEPSVSQVCQPRKAWKSKIGVPTPSSMAGEISASSRPMASVLMVEAAMPSFW
jgi:hypothetical protein